jgi:holin-like protein
LYSYTIIRWRKTLSILGEFAIILSVLLFSQGLQIYFNVSVPATIIGMIILLSLLWLGMIKLKWIENISDLLLKNLAILFIPAGVGIMKELHFLKGNIFPILFILLITTLVVILFTGFTVQYLIIRGKDKNGKIS